MIEIDINQNFDYKIKRHKENSLIEIITRCEKSIKDKIRSSPKSTERDVKNYDNLLHNFICAYTALTEEIEKQNIFRFEDAKSRFNSIRTYSLYASSKAMCNKTLDEDVEKARNLELMNETSPFTFSDLNNQTDYNLLSSVIPKIEKCEEGNNIYALKYNYFSLFNALRQQTQSLLSKCKPETKSILNQIKIYKNGLEFNDIKEPQKSEFKNDEDLKKKVNYTTLEKLPNELPTYNITKSSAELSKVIGNEEAIIKLRHAIVMLQGYDTKTRTNVFKEDNGNFIDLFLLYGLPGVGKNYTVDALINHVNKNIKPINSEIEIVDLSAGLKSMYQDRKSMVFQHYINMQRNSNKVYINIIDELDGLFKKTNSGELTGEDTQFLREMKSALNNNEKGNSIYIFMTNYAERFEAAIKNRCYPIKLDGPTKAEHFSRLIKQEFGKRINNFSTEEIDKLGAKIEMYKTTFESSNPPIPVTGRNIEAIAKPFVSPDEELVIKYEKKIIGMSKDKLRIEKYKLFKPINYEMLDKHIDSYFAKLKESEEKTTANFNQ